MSGHGLRPLANNPRARSFRRGISSIERTVPRPFALEQQKLMMRTAEQISDAIAFALTRQIGGGWSDLEDFKSIGRIAIWKTREQGRHRGYQISSAKNGMVDHLRWLLVHRKYEQLDGLIAELQHADDEDYEDRLIETLSSLDLGERVLRNDQDDKVYGCNLRELTDEEGAGEVGISLPAFKSAQYRLQQRARELAMSEAAIPPNHVRFPRPVHKHPAPRITLPPVRPQPKRIEGAVEEERIAYLMTPEHLRTLKAEMWSEGYTACLTGKAGKNPYEKPWSKSI
jgi:DNA-directed RNA polymerase specialized sigma24 family protein